MTIDCGVWLCAGLLGHTSLRGVNHAHCQQVEWGKEGGGWGGGVGVSEKGEGDTPVLASINCYMHKHDFFLTL